jgi:hypothetical protein
MDAAARETNVAEADGEVVWFWRPDAGVKLVRSKLLLRGEWWLSSPAHQEEHEVTRNTIAQGMPDCLANLW